MRTSETTIGVITDPEAPIFNVAHCGAERNVHEMADQLERLLG
jgi:electron transfer flavoprotein alpha subunit